MKVLVVGSGGREHALCWKIAQSPLVEAVHCAPGNAGTATCAANAPYGVDDLFGLQELCDVESIDLVVVGPEAPLADGLVDQLRDAEIQVFGPTEAAARLESSKIFSKNLMNKYNIPTARSQSFTDVAAAKDYAASLGLPVVLKADGLAAGKGVLICQSAEDVADGLDRILVKREFGSAGKEALVEEFLDGEEVSFFALTDGKAIVPLATSQDHKRIFDNDEGPNTGGMGAYSPAPIVTPELHDEIMTTVIEPTVKAMEAEGCPYQGVVYAGLMIVDGKPKVLEYNVRFGDPECQPLMMRLKSDIVPLLQACADGTLEGHTVEWHDEAAVCVVLTSGGYPGAYEKGIQVHGLDQTFDEGVVVFHAGTKNVHNHVQTNGGRVLGVTALAPTIDEAIKKAYANVPKITFDGMHYRKDIGAKAARHLG
ncbi:MAG: phosphoribosylamine--glycine ligase [Deltaproteobacteria bacterium]|nr:phosphoribosylamine--glycine ligase [Deltaproteobacteria bacterium]